MTTRKHARTHAHSTRPDEARARKPASSALPTPSPRPGTERRLAEKAPPPRGSGTHAHSPLHALWSSHPFPPTQPGRACALRVLRDRPAFPALPWPPEESQSSRPCLGNTCAKPEAAGTSRWQTSFWLRILRGKGHTLGLNSAESQEAGRGVWAGSGVKGHRAAKGAERAGGGWRLRRLFISGGRVTEAGTRLRRVRQREKSGGRSQHAQPGDGCGEWLGVPAWAHTPSSAPRLGLLSAVPVSGPASSSSCPPAARPRPSSSSRPDRGGADPPLFPRVGSRGLLRRVSRSFPAPGPGPAPERLPRGRDGPFIDSLR